MKDLLGIVMDVLVAEIDMWLTAHVIAGYVNINGRPSVTLPLSTLRGKKTRCCH